MKKYTTRDRSDAQERRCAGYYAAIVNPNSGAVGNYALKGDLRNTTHQIECKCTASEIISVKKDDVVNIYKQASVNGKKFIMNYEFQGENPEDVHINLTTLPTKDFIEMYEVYKLYIEKEKEKRVEKISGEEFIRTVLNKLSDTFRTEVKLFMKTRNVCMELYKLIK